MFWLHLKMGESTLNISKFPPVYTLYWPVLQRWLYLSPIIIYVIFLSYEFRKKHLAV